MPGGLGAIAEWNLLSATVNAALTLFASPGATSGGGWPGHHAHLLAILLPVRIMAVFLPLSALRYCRMSR